MTVRLAKAFIILTLVVVLVILSATVLKRQGTNSSAAIASASAKPRSAPKIRPVLNRTTKSQRPLQGGAAVVRNDTEDLGHGVSLDMVRIPAGTFYMGSPTTETARSNGEGPVHCVELDGFWMGKTEVTQRQYEEIMGKNPSYFKGADRPVEQVTWHNAAEFCRNLSAKTKKTYVLPTEAQWEYACRAGTRTPYFGGRTISAEQANYDASYTYGSGVVGAFRQGTTPTGSFAPNGFGLYDMHGNVWEWCKDWYGDDYYRRSPSKNPTGPGSGKLRVLRGGSWMSDPKACRSASRDANTPTYKHLVIGFRVARVSQPRK